MPNYRRLPSGKWQATVYLPDGSRHTRSHALKNVVKAWAIDHEARIARGELRDPKLTVAAWFDRWRDSRVVEDDTERGDQYSHERVIRAFGTRPLFAVTRLEVQRWIKQMIADDVGRAAINRTFNYLRAGYNAAVADGLVGGTPCRKITLPANPPQQPRWYSLGEVLAIVDELDEPHATMVLLMAWDALRWGEAAGLRVRDVDWTHSVIRIEGALTQGGGWKEYPKTSRSRRTLPVPEGVALRMRQLVDGRRDGDSLVFVTRRGRRPLSGSNWRKVWDVAVGTAGVRVFEPRGPHVLRHTGISWLVQRGVDLYKVMEFAGHESMKTTQRYAHLAPDKYDAIMRTWESMDVTIEQVPELEANA